MIDKEVKRQSQPHTSPCRLPARPISKIPGNLRANGEQGAAEVRLFNDLFRDRALGITESQRTSWEQGRLIPTQILLYYFDEGLPFVPEAPITAMRLATFQRKLEELAGGHHNPAVRQLAESVKTDISMSISGFDRVGKPDPRRRPKVKLIPPKYDKK